MKESIVVISGHRYRYEYVDGATVYRGPVGDAPELSEQEFLAAMIIPDHQRLVGTLEKAFGEIEGLYSISSESRGDKTTIWAVYKQKKNLTTSIRVEIENDYEDPDMRFMSVLVEEMEGTRTTVWELDEGRYESHISPSSIAENVMVFMAENSSLDLKGREAR